MRVVVEGVLQHVEGRTTIQGWTVELDRRYPTLNVGDGAQKLVACVLIHIASKHGVDLVEGSAAGQAEAIEQPLAECFDADREALDVIAMARWREQGE